MSWKLRAVAGQTTADAALEAQAAAPDWDADVVVTASEIAPDRPGTWAVEAYYPRRPAARDKKAFAALFPGDAPDISAEKLPETDWVTRSQQDVTPIRAGRFYVHTPDHPPSDSPGMVSFCIPASQAFGTGQHETTAGCLAMLDTMRREGVIVRNFADTGSGTGLLAFAARALWPRALGLASDIDPVCAPVMADNARANSVPLGARPGAIVPVIADGMDDPVIAARGPYDLLIANILAAPLIALAPDFARATAPGASLVLAGLLESQEAAVRRAMFRAGFRLARRAVHGDWSILWLRRRSAR